MNTADKVQRMFYKAAAAKRLNSKIMQKRATAANRPSDAYLAGFCKVAEDAGVDPENLMKVAWLSSSSVMHGSPLLEGEATGLLGAAPGFIAGGIKGMRKGGKGFWNGAMTGAIEGYKKMTPPKPWTAGTNAPASFGAVGSGNFKGVGTVARQLQVGRAPQPGPRQTMPSAFTR